MNVLVLGGNGYLGSKVIQEILKDSSNKVVFTKRQNSDLSRLNFALGGGCCIKGIPASIDAIEAAMEYECVDLVLNMACSYGRKSVLYDNVIEANIDFPLRVLNHVVEKGTKRFLTIGTGLPDELNMYSFSKKMFSDFGKYYAKYHEIDFFNLKLEMFYGADEPGNRFIPNIIEKMIRGDEVNVTIGTQKRDIISVEDIISAIMMILNSDLHGYQEISVGTGVAPTISELVDYIWEETGKKSIVHKGTIPMRDNEPDCAANTEVLRSLGEWSPTGWKTGISNMIKEIGGRVL